MTKLPISQLHRASQKLQEMKRELVLGYVTNYLAQVSFYELFHLGFFLFTLWYIFAFNKGCVSQ